MIRITKLTDYGIVLLARFARDPDARTHNVRDLAAETHLPQPTVGKLLKMLARSGLLVSQRGVKGGYALARQPDEITISQIISALDGPIAITDCSADPGGKCELERLCAVRTNWQRINVAIRDAMEHLTLADMSRPLPSGFMPLRNMPAPATVPPVRTAVMDVANTNSTEVLELCPP
jgi:FeS assembly SUF system regulator